MTRRWRPLVVLLLTLAPAWSCARATFAHGRIPKIALYDATHPSQRFAILLSDADGWNDAMARLATALAADGTLVAGVDTPALLRALVNDGEDCVDLVGDFENLAHFAQGYRHLPAYFTPLLVGVGSGAQLAQATLERAPAGIFAGLVALDPCPNGAQRPPSCPASSAPVPGAPRRTLIRSDGRCPNAGAAGAEAAQARRTDTAAAPDAVRAAVRALAPPPPNLAAVADDLPLVEIPAAAAAARFAIFLSGDGGWAGLDKEVAQTLAAHGLPVVGFDSLRYFWSARTPARLAVDLERLIRGYAARWHATEVVLIGYSQGADVLPFAVNRLPRAARRLVSNVVLLAPGARASFEFHLDDWLRRDPGGLALAPELARLSAREVVCVYGRDDRDSVCPALTPSQARRIALAGDHHFDGDYATLAARILTALDRSAAPALPGRPSLGHAG